MNTITQLPTQKRTKEGSRKQRPQNKNRRKPKPTNFAQLYDAFIKIYVPQNYTTDDSKKIHSLRARLFCEWCEIEEFGLDELDGWDVEVYLSGLTYRRGERKGKPMKPNTIHGHARVIRTLLGWAARKKFIQEPGNRLCPVCARQG